MLVAPGGADMTSIHDRMPVILDPSVFDVWLVPTNEDTEELRALLRPRSPERWSTTPSARALAASATTTALIHPV